MLELLEHDADLCGRKRPVLWRKGSDRGWTDVIGRIGDLLAVQNGKAVDLLEDIPHMDSSCRRAPFDDLAAVSA